MHGLGDAEMAELVDALGSGPSGGNTVEVRVLFWAPIINKMVRASEPFLFCAQNRQGRSLLCARVLHTG